LKKRRVVNGCSSCLPLVVNLLGSYAHGKVECSSVVGLPDSDPALSHGIACDRAGSIPPVGAFEFEVQADRGIPLIVSSIAANASGRDELEVPLR
jgi:hypothetical protein